MISKFVQPMSYYMYKKRNNEILKVINYSYLLEKDKKRLILNRSGNPDFCNKTQVHENPIRHNISKLKKIALSKSCDNNRGQIQFATNNNKISLNMTINEHPNKHGNNNIESRKLKEIIRLRLNKK